MAITPSDFTYRQELTGADYTKTGAQHLVIDANSVDASFFTAVKNGGGDIRVCLDSDGINQLPIDVRLCDTGTNTLTVWVRRTTYNTLNRNIFIFCGNAALSQPAATDPFGRNSVYQSCENAYMGGELSDSTGNGADLTPVGSPVLVNSKYSFGNGDGYKVTSTNGSFGTSDVLVQKYWINRTERNPDPTTPAREILVYWGTAGISDGFNVSIDSRNVADGSLYVFTNGGNVGNQVGVALDINTDYLVHAVFDQPNDTVTLYLNGALYYEVTNYLDNSAGGQEIWLGVRTDNTGGLIGEMWNAMFCVGSISEEQIALEYANQSNPGAFWTQSTPDDPSAGAGTDLLTDSISDLQSISSPSLLQDYILVMQSLSSSNSLTNVELTSSQDLTVANLSNVNLLDSPDLLQNSLISPDELDSVSSIDNIDLLQDSVLNVDSLDSSIILDDVALSLSSVLNTIDLSSLTSISLPVLTQAQILSVDNITTSSSLSEAALVLAGVLNLASLGSSTLLGQPTVIQSHALIVDTLNQLNFLDNTLISQEAQLIVDSLISPSFLDESSLEAGDVVSVDSLDSVNTLDDLVLTENAVLLTNPLNNSQSLSFVVFGIVPELEAYTITFSQQSDKISYNIDLIKVKFGE